MPLTVRFKGNNTLYNKSHNGNISVGAGLIITGEGTLNAECHGNMAEGSIYAEGNITIDSVNITAVQDKAAAPVIKAVGGNITISGAGTTVNLTNSSNNMLTEGTSKYVPYTVEADGDITVSGGAVLTASQTADNDDFQAIVGTVKTDETGTIIAGKTEEDAAAVSADNFNTNSSQYKYVKVKTVVPHKHCICGASHQAVGNHTNEEQIEFTAWDNKEAANQFATYENKTAANALPKTAGNYYLEGDVCLDEAWDAPEGVVLCLNGHKITTKSGVEYKVDHDRNIALIGVINKESLTVTDCKGSGSITNEGQVENTKGVVVKWYDNSAGSTSFNMYGITIEGFTDSGVCTDYTNSNFNMYSGTITGNTAQKGGGVNAHNGTFTMYGGTITRNTATENGGGVYNGFKIGEKATVTGNYKGIVTDRLDNNVYLPSYRYIIIPQGASTESRVGVTTETTPNAEDGSDAVGIAMADRNESVTNLEAFKTCFVSDADGEHIKAVYGNDSYAGNAIKFVRNPLPEQSGFEFAEAEVKKTYGDKPFTKTAGGNIGGIVTYTSDNPNVATVDNNGTVTVKGAGEVTITATVSRTDEYAETSASYKLIVDRKLVDAPAADTTEFVYDGNAKTYTLEESEAYTVSGNVQTNAGSHDVTVSLTDNYRWPDGNTNAKTYKFVIKKAVVDMLDFKDPVGDFVYTGKKIVPELVGDKSKVNITGETAAKDVKAENNGFYAITISLKDTKNYRWNTSDEYPDWTQPQVTRWRILPADKIKITAEDQKAYVGDAVPENSYTVKGLLGEDSLGGKAVYKYRLINEDETGSKELDEPDMSKAGKYQICISGLEAPAGNNYKGIELIDGTLTISKKQSSGSHYKPVQKPVIEAGDGSKTELGTDGTKVTITVEEGYELVDVLVNGISKGKVTELTGLKTGDKVEIKTEKIPEKLEPQAVKNIVKELKLVARSERLSNGNVRIRVTKITDINDNPVDLDELERNGYTVKFKYYRSVKKSAGYDTRLEKEADINSYINNFGDKGTKYYYKVKVMVYDADGNLVAQSNLNQCKYAMRTWIK